MSGSHAPSEALRGLSIAVYGGTGLIGGSLVARAAELATGAPIYAIAREPPIVPVPGVIFVAASVLDEASMAAVPRADLAIFAAGAASNYLDDPVNTVRVATEGFERFLRTTSAARRRLVVGSARIYGTRADETPLREDDPCRVRSPDLRNVYEGAKIVAEALARHASSNDRPVVVARLGNAYGPSLGRPAGTAFGAFVAQARRERRIVVSGPPGSQRNHIHVRDAAEGLLRCLALGRSGEAYNIGSRDHASNEVFARTIAAAAPYEVAVEFANPSAAPDNMILSIEKAERELMYAPAHRLDEHLGPAVRWELEHRT